MRGWVALGLALATTLTLAAQTAPTLAGRLDATGVWSDTSPETMTGLVGGWAGLTSGTATVKTEVRLTLAEPAAQSVGLGRAWVKARGDGWRLTTGWGRLGWGTGWVFVPGDLLNNSTATPDGWTADELRSTPGWLGDLWWSLADEAFVEVAARPTAAGLRVSAAPGGVTLEASGLWDQAQHQPSGALSVQAPLPGADVYATARVDGVGASTTGTGSAGLFALAAPLDGVTLSSRHEALAGTTDPATTWRTYHDLTVGWEAWTLTVRGLSQGAWQTWSGSADLAWAPWQGLTFRAAGTWTPPRTFSLGATSRW